MKRSRSIGSERNSKKRSIGSKRNSKKRSFRTRDRNAGKELKSKHRAIYKHRIKTDPWKSKHRAIYRRRIRTGPRINVFEDFKRKLLRPTSDSSSIMVRFARRTCALFGAELSHRSPIVRRFGVPTETFKENFGISSPYLGLGEYTEPLTEALLYADSATSKEIIKKYKSRELGNVGKVLGTSVLGLCIATYTRFNNPAIPHHSVQLIGKDGNYKVISPMVKSGYFKDKRQYILSINNENHAFLLLVGWPLTKEDGGERDRTGFLFEGHLGAEISRDVLEAVRRDLGLRRVVHAPDIVHGSILQGGYGICASLAMNMQLIASRNPNVPIAELIKVMMVLGMPMIGTTWYAVLKFKKDIVQEIRENRQIVMRELFVHTFDGSLKLNDMGGKHFYTSTDEEWVLNQLRYLSPMDFNQVTKIIYASTIAKVASEYLDGRAKTIFFSSFKYPATELDSVIQTNPAEIYRLVKFQISLMNTDDIDMDNVDSIITVPSRCSLVPIQDCDAAEKCKRCGLQCMHKENDICIRNRIHPYNEAKKELGEELGEELSDEKFMHLVDEMNGFK